MFSLGENHNSDNASLQPYAYMYFILSHNRGNNKTKADHNHWSGTGKFPK